jgi:hypothetical protein
MHRILIAVGVAVMAMAGVTAPASASSGHHIWQTDNALSCESSWYNTFGGTTCTGNPHQGWRLHVKCWGQGSYTGPWNWGAGSDGFECTWSVTHASVEWA